MIHVVTADNRAFYESQLDAMHRLRRELFIVGRGWSLEERDGGEFDRSDDARAIYLLMLDQDAQLLCGMRLRPTDDWSVLTDALPHLVMGDAARLKRPDVWEMTRHVSIGLGTSAPEARRRSAEIRVAMTELALRDGISQFIGAMDTGLLGPATKGWIRLKAAGLPQPYPEGGSGIGFTIPVSEGLLADLRREFACPVPIAFELDPDSPLSRRSIAELEVRSRARQGADGYPPSLAPVGLRCMAVEGAA